MQSRLSSITQLPLAGIVISLGAFWPSTEARASTLAAYDFTGTVRELSNAAGLFPANATTGASFDLQVVVDTSVPGISGNNVSLENYGQASAGGPFPVQSASLELNGGTPLEILGTPNMTEQGGPVNHVSIQHNDMLSGGSLLDELVIGMTGLQSNGNPGYFLAVAADQTFGAPPGFTTSVQLGAPLGPTPATAINAFEGNMPVSFSVCGNATCSTGSSFSGSISEITVAPVPLPDSSGLLLGGLAAIGWALRVARRRVRHEYCLTPPPVPLPAH